MPEQICGRCNTPNPATARFCSGCREPLGDLTSLPTAVTEGSAPGAGISSYPDSRAPYQRDHDLRTGDRFGPRYVLIERLGKGGMGEVWKAQDEHLDQVVALKLIRPHLLEDPEVAERMKHEINLARKVTHKNVNRIYDLGEVEGTRFISMEYLEGVSLKQFLGEEGALPEEKVIPIIENICEGLKAAHDAGVIHRDLKPQNILIDHEGGAHIMDFGIALSGDTRGMTRTGALLGTPDYMSPEQVRGEKLDHRSDIYSLGLLMYEMVTADLPFTSDDTASSMYKRLTQKPRRPRQLKTDVPPFMEKIILRCLEKERGFRYADVGKLLNDLRRRRATTMAITAKVVPGVRSRARLLIGLAVAVVAVVAVGVLVLRRGTPLPPTEPPPSRIPAVAFLPFENSTQDGDLDWVRSGLPALAAQYLEDASTIRLISGRRSQQTLQDLGLSLAGAYSSFELRRTASVLGADILVTGSVGRAEDRLRIEANLNRPGAGEPIKLVAEGEPGFGGEEFAGLAARLAQQVSKSLKVKLPADPTTGPVLTHSAESLRQYSKALELVRRGDDAQAADLVEAALEEDSSFALAHLLLSEIYARQGRREEALEAAGRALENRDEISRRDAHRLVARQAIWQDRPEEAIQEFRKLLETLPSDVDSRADLALLLEERGELEEAAAELEGCLSTDPQNTTARYNLGRIRTKQGLNETALEIFSQLLADYTRADSDEGKAKVYLALGNVKLLAGDYAEALDYFERSLEIHTQKNNRAGMAVALGNIADIRRVQGQYEEAIEASERALEIKRGVRDRLGEATEQITLGEIYEEAGRIRDAKRQYQESLRIARDLDNPALMGKILGSLGYVTSVLGDYSEAYVFHQEALEKRRKVGNKSEILRSLIEMELIEQWFGRYDKALQYAAEAEQMIDETGEIAGKVVLALNVGQIHNEQGSYAVALRTLTGALEEARRMEHVHFVACAHLYLGGALAHLGDLAGAEAQLAEAKHLIEEMEFEVLKPELLNYQAEVSGTRGERDDALAALRDALRSAEEMEDRRLVLLTRLNLGRWTLSGGDPKGRSRLEEVAQEAGALGLLPLEIRALSYLASIPRQEHPNPEAVRSAQAALRKGKTSGLRESMIAALWVLARDEQAAGNSAQASSHYQQAAGLLREMSEGLDETRRPVLLGRKDLAQLAREVAEQVPVGGN